MKKIYGISVLLILIIFSGCQKSFTTNTSDEYKKIEINLDNTGKETQSTEASNLITTAIKEKLNVDVVFYPTENLKDNGVEISIDTTEEGIENKLGSDITVEDLKSAYSDNAQEDTILMAYMDGDDIRDFIISRSKEKYEVDVQTSGLYYDLRFKGGELEQYTMSIDGKKLDGDKNYKVAFMLMAYGNSPDSGFMINFPGYYYKNNFSYMSIIPTNYKATEVLVDYIEDLKGYKDFSEKRSEVTKVIEEMENYIIPIYELQGEKHLSEYRGKQVKTKGVITGYTSDDYNRDHGFYLQSSTGDGNPYTSDGIFVSTTKEIMDSNSSKIQVGNEIELIGTVYEDFSNVNLSRTTLRDIKEDSIVDSGSDVEFPEPVALGEGGDRVMPNFKITSYNGDVNTKERLNLTEGLGFWESLEGMRVKILDPIVTGSSGGKEDKYDNKKYLNLFVRPSGVSREKQITPSNGLVIDVENNDYNPEIVNMMNHSFVNEDGDRFGGLKANGQDIKSGGFIDKVYNVGDNLSDVIGISDYNLNDFGSGEYVLLPMSEVINEENRTSITPISEREHTELESDASHVTIATYNIENLGGKESDGSDDYSGKWDDIGEVISKNMKNPDVVVFTEVQDNDGNQHSTVTEANLALEKIIDGIEKADGPTDYKFININPIAYSDGGEPGGNIRVAAIYRSSRLEFDPRGETGDKIVEDNNGNSDPSSTIGSKAHVGLDEDGYLLNNPGRVYPNTDIFKGTRKSLAMEFKFNNQVITVIGNHFNSKGGDSSLWGGNQPVNLRTETKRIELAKIINGFSREMLGKRPDANLILLGDFNEFYASAPMQTLKGTIFTNLVEILPYNKRYSYNYSGNSQAIDHVFISEQLKKHEPEIDILYLNSDYMGKISDHNPVISRYKF